MPQGVREEVIEAAVGVQRSHVQAILERLQVCLRFDLEYIYIYHKHYLYTLSQS